jgi:hypothetical protein
MTVKDSLLTNVIFNFDSFNNELLQALGKSIIQFSLGRIFYFETADGNQEWHKLFRNDEKLLNLIKYFSG